MKFRKFGKALLMSALSAGAVLGVTSCVQSYTVGFLYVTGTVTAGSNGQGIISGFKIDHNTGNLVPINGLPVASGGANPGRAVLPTGGQPLPLRPEPGRRSGYRRRLHRHDRPAKTPTSPSLPSAETASSPRRKPSSRQGPNPFRILVDSSGNFLFVLDAVAPSPDSCALALGSGVTSCGDITAFKIDQSTGRLTLVINAQVTSASGSAFPTSRFRPTPSIWRSRPLTS